MLQREKIEEASQLLHFTTEYGKKITPTLSYQNAAVQLAQYSGTSLDKSEGFTILKNLLNDHKLPDSNIMLNIMVIFLINITKQ